MVNKQVVKNMKQAFLICAHNNPEYLGQLIDSLDTERTNIYVHIDKNNEAKFTNFAERFQNRSNVKRISRESKGLACNPIARWPIKSVISQTKRFEDENNDR